MEVFRRYFRVDSLVGLNESFVDSDQIQWGYRWWFCN